MGKINGRLIFLVLFFYNWLKIMRNIQFFVLILLCAFVHMNSYAKMLLMTDYSDKPIHIFYENIATQPALLGMIQMVQLPKDEIKVFYWHRFPNRKNFIDLKTMSAIEIQTEAEIKKILDDNQKSPIVLYLNIRNETFLKNLLTYIPLNRIKKLNLYNDGSGEILTKKDEFLKIKIQKSDVDEVRKNLYDPTKNLLLKDNLLLHQIIPTSYYFIGVDKAKKDKDYDSFFKNMQLADIKDISFEDIGHILTDEQKKLLYQFVDFDINFYQQIYQDAPVFMFLMANYRRNFSMYNAELLYIKELMKKYPHYHFVLKTNFAESSYNRNQLIKKMFPKAVIVNKKIPYELFIISGLKPQKIAGGASSLFFILDAKLIEGYILWCDYLPAYRKYLNLPKEKEISFDKLMPEIPFFYDDMIMYNNQEDYIKYMTQFVLVLYRKNKLMAYRKFYDYLIMNEISKSHIHNFKRLSCPQKYGYACKVHKKQNNIYKPILLNQLIIFDNKNDENYYYSDGKILCDWFQKCGFVKQKTKFGLTICWDKNNCSFYLNKEKNHYYQTPKVFEKFPSFYFVEKLFY